MRRHTLFHAGGANDFGIAALDEDRAFGMFGVMAGDTDIAELIRLSLAWAHGMNP
jgi:hypothetical protein